MTERFAIGDPAIDINVRRSARARRIGLRISRTDGSVILTLPSRGNLDSAMSFASEHEGWLRRTLQKQAPPIVPVFGARVPVDGVLHLIEPGPGRYAVRDGDVLRVPGGAHQLAGKLQAFYKLRARDALVPASERYAGLLGHRIGRVTLRDTRSRWGSCTSQGNLMYSWRLAMAPPAVQDYVAAHEVCHLIEMNHSRDFWKLVAKICPEYDAQRRWLRRQGAELHRYQFRA